MKSKISGFVETGVPLFRVKSYIEKSANLATVNKHIIDNNLNTDAKRIRYLEQLERQLKLNEDQIAEDPDLQVDSVGVPIADYRTNLKKRYERELQRLAETEVVYKPVIDKAAMQVQLQVEEPPAPEVQEINVEDVDVVNDISIKNAEKINNKTDVSQMLNLLKLKSQTQTHFNKELTKLIYL